MHPELPDVIATSDVDADAVLLVDGGTAYLVLNRRQTFDSAVAAAAAVLRRDFPAIHPDQVRKLVRKALPGLPTLDTVVAGEAVPPVHRATPERQLAPSGPQQRHRRSALTNLLLAATVAAAGVGVGWLVPRTYTPQPAQAMTQASPSSAYIGDPAFREFAEAGQMRCTPLGPLQARCTDVDRMVMYSEAAISPTSIAYSFSYGTERIFVMAFRTAADAHEWELEARTQPLQNLIRVSRFVLWGSDAPRLAEYRKLIESAEDRDPGTVTDGLTMGMPERLATLAFGTLGVSESRLAAAEASSSRLSSLLSAVRLVMGGDKENESEPETGALTDGTLVSSLLSGTPPTAAGSGSPGPTTKSPDAGRANPGAAETAATPRPSGGESPNVTAEFSSAPTSPAATPSPLQTAAAGAGQPPEAFDAEDPRGSRREARTAAAGGPPRGDGRGAVGVAVLVPDHTRPDSGRLRVSFAKRTGP
ncbi:hypothetical protein [Kitasatospora sp. NPDC090091]|uniref:hypothetical protein n=1 Tax=Kitasatospora sp. NPDC090091 TaxID=3364081 RepID=UPI0038058E08